MKLGRSEQTSGTVRCAGAEVVTVFVMTSAGASEVAAWLRLLSEDAGGVALAGGSCEGTRLPLVEAEVA